MTARQDELGGQTPARRSGWLGIALCLVFASELLAFCISVQRQYAWVYPRWFDQNQYLMEGYTAYGVARTHGLQAGIASAFEHGSPQGALHAFFSLLVFEVVGPSRLAALSLNLLALVALQLATFFALVRLSNSRAIGWAAVAALAAIVAPWAGHWGSATDFRLDWMAACAFGAALSAGLMCRGFRSTPGAILFGVAVGVVLLVRFLTAVYFCGILVVLLAWLLTFEPDRMRRCGRLILSALVAAALAAWPFWKARSLIYSYYWIGHYGGPEAYVRSTHEGRLESVGWMVKEILFRQIGSGSLVLCLGVLVCFLLYRRRAAAPASSGLRDSWVIAATFFTLPTLVLMTHPEKAEAPAEIIAPAAMWLLFLAWITLSRGVPGRALVRVCAAAAVLGFLLFGFFQIRRPVSPAQVTGFRDINSASDFIYFRSQEAGLARPVLAVTWTADSLNAGGFWVLGFERHGKVVPFIQSLPTSILEMPRAGAFGQLSASDFVCVVTRAGATWPIDRQMASMAPELMRWCEANMVRDGDIDTPEIAASVFERRNLGGPDSPVNLKAMVERGRSLAAWDRLPPPGRPFLRVTTPILWSAASPVHYEVRMAYSPYTIAAVQLPLGVSLDAETGELSGHFPATGDYMMKLRATNANGPSEVSLPFHVVEPDWTAEMVPAREARVGVPTTVDFSAFDARGTLDFIDITDLTESKVLTRLVAAEDEHMTWHGRYRFILTRPGSHNIIARTVRYDAGTSVYTYVDRAFEVNVSP